MQPQLRRLLKLVLVPSYLTIFMYFLGKWTHHWPLTVSAKDTGWLTYWVSGAILNIMMFGLIGIGWLCVKYVKEGTNAFD